MPPAAYHSTARFSGQIGPWYTTPAALEILNAISQRPAIETVRCPLGGFTYPQYTGAAIEALIPLYQAASQAALAARPFDESAAAAVLAATPHTVIAALYGSAGWLDDDVFGVWPVIRGSIAAALALAQAVTA